MSKKSSRFSFLFFLGSLMFFSFLVGVGVCLYQVFPYKYQYEGPECVDHHIGDDGWSR